MKTPRINDFDPDAKSPILKSSLDNMPSFEKQRPLNERVSQAPTPLPINNPQHHKATVKTEKPHATSDTIVRDVHPVPPVRPVLPVDSGLRVAELAKLNKDNLDWQNHRLMIYGKGGPYWKLSKRRIIPLSPRVQPLLEGHLGLHDNMKIGVRTIQRIVKQVANRAHIRRKVSPHVLRHTFSVTCIQKGISTRALQENFRT